MQKEFNIENRTGCFKQKEYLMRYLPLQGGELKIAMIRGRGDRRIPGDSVEIVDTQMWEGYHIDKRIVCQY